MMKYLSQIFFTGIFAAALLFLSSGCAAVQEENKLSEDQLAILDKTAEKKCIEILDAFKNNDYALLQKNLPPTLAKQFSKAVFTQTRNSVIKSLGEIKSYDFVTRLKAPVFRNVIYKITFKRTGSDGKEIEQEALFRIMLAENNGKIQVLSFVFF